MSSNPCIHFGDCGGCQLQHLDEAAYRAGKMQLLEEMKARLGVECETEWVWVGPGTRRRAEFKAHDGKLGFYAEGSHRVVPISQCPALEPAIWNIVPALQVLCARHNGIEKIFVTAADSGLDVAVTGKGNLAPDLIKLTNEQKLARVTMNGELVASLMPVRMNFSDHWVELAPGGFLQPTRAGQKAITDIVDKFIPKAKRIAEFFAGSGTYSFMLAKKAPVEAYEFSDAAVAALNKAAGGKVKAHARDIEKFPVQPQELDGVDTAVLNPPRNGAGPQSKALAKSKVKRIVMVSCHPETLERDLGFLIKAGFKVKAMVGIDQFHWTKHLETVVKLER